MDVFKRVRNRTNPQTISKIKTFLNMYEILSLKNSNPTPEKMEEYRKRLNSINFYVHPTGKIMVWDIQSQHRYLCNPDGSYFKRISKNSMNNFIHNCYEVKFEIIYHAVKFIHIPINWELIGNGCDATHEFYLFHQVRDNIDRYCLLKSFNGFTSDFDELTGATGETSQKVFVNAVSYLKDYFPIQTAQDVEVLEDYARLISKSDVGQFIKSGKIVMHE